jgi:hypothetical protein
MLYNTCIDGTQDRTGFIYIDGSDNMNKYTGTNRNPKQFTTTNTAYLWKVVEGLDNHISLQNVSNSKYYGYRLDKNDSAPNDLFMYPWGEQSAKQAGANSQNENDPSQKTNNADITFENNKVYIIGNGSDTFWNGNPGDIVTWSTGHPFAFYEIEEVYTVTYTITDPSGATLTGTYEDVENADPSFSGMGYTLTDKTWTKGEGLTATFTATLSFTDELPFNVSNMSTGGTKNYYTIYGFLSSYPRYWYRGTDNSIKSASSGTNASFLWNICSFIKDGVLGFKIYNVLSEKYVTGSTAGQTLTLGDGTLYVYAENTSLGGFGFRVYNTENLISFTSSTVGTNLSIWTKSGTTHKGSNLTFAKVDTYNVTETENLNDIDNYGSYSYFNVPDGATLNIDVADFDLTKVYGLGNVVLDADVTLSGGKSTVATGKLTINEDKTLTIGSGDTQTNSIASFASIDFAGTIRHQNKTITLNNVTVPTGKTGKIFAFDMGPDTDGFKLAGTTTLNGDLTVCSRWNFQMKVDELAGSGTWLICGTNGNSFDPSATSSQELAVVKVGSSPKFTGTIHEANSNSQLSVIGTLKNCTLKGTNTSAGYPLLADGAVLDGVVLKGNKRINTSGTVTIKDFAGNDLESDTYAFVGNDNSTINFSGSCDLTLKSDGETTNNNSLVGYNSTCKIVVMDGAVKAGAFYNSQTDNNNASITVNKDATLTWTNTQYYLWAKDVTNNGTIDVPTSIANAATLTGIGNINLSIFPGTTAPTMSDWKGTITFPSSSGKTDLAAIFNAWGNTNSTIKLHSVDGWLPGLAEGNEFTVYPTLDILEGQTLTINNGSSNTQPVLKKITGAGILEQTWSGGSNYTLKIGTLTGFTGTLQGTNKTIVVEKLVVSSAPYPNTRLIKTSGTVTLNNLYIGLERTTAYTWETKTVEEVTGIYVATFNEVQLHREMAVATVSPYFYHIGTGVGKYTISLGKDEKYTSISEFETAILAWSKLSDCSTPIVTINQPTSAFYRIKAGDKYLQDARKSDEHTQRTLTDAEGADEAIGTLFYLNDNTFIGYQTGYGFGFSVCQTQDTEHLNTQLFTESAEMGKYTIQSQQGTCTSASYNEGYWGVDGSDLSRVDDAASGACWTLEPATSVPVTFKKAGLGYATFCSPVAVKVPEGVIALVSKIKDNTISLYKIDKIKDENNNIIIPARTPVMLYKSGVSENTDVLFPISDYSGDKITEDFYGTIATETMKSGYTYYSLRAWKAYDSEETSKVGFVLKDSGNLTGFRAWIEIPGTAGARDFTIVFDGDEAPTGIVEALGFENDNVDIYDLNGRKLSSYRKGINIVNGKKVMVQ